MLLAVMAAELLVLFHFEIIQLVLFLALQQLLLTRFFFSMNKNFLLNFTVVMPLLCYRCIGS